MLRLGHFEPHRRADSYGYTDEALNTQWDPETDADLRRQYMALAVTIQRELATVPVAATNRKRSGESISREVSTGMVRQLADELKLTQTRDELSVLLPGLEASVLTACRELQMLLASVDRLVFIGCGSPADGELIEGQRDALKRRALRMVEPGIPPAQLTEERIAGYMQLYFDACRVGSQMPLAWIAARFASGVPRGGSMLLTSYAAERALRRSHVAVSVLRSYGIDADLI